MTFTASRWQVSLCLVVLASVLVMAGCGAETGVEPAPTATNTQEPAAASEVPSPTPSPEITLQPTDSDSDLSIPMTSPDYGVQAFLFWQEEVADRDLRLIEEAGFRWVKQEFAWREIEGAGKGQFDWSKADRLVEQIDARGLHIIARVGVQPAWAGGNYPEVSPPEDMQDFADFLTALATRYRGRIAAYQIWNEPNLAREWGENPPNPAEYTELLKLSYEAVKKADPAAYVISAGLAPTTRWDDVAVPDTVYLQGMYEAGAAPYFDLLGVHGAGYKVSPQTAPEEVASSPELNNHDPSSEELRRIYCFRHVEDMRAVMVAHGDEAKRVVLLEFGWTTDPRAGSPYKWHAVTEEQHAQYLVDAYAYARENWQPWIAVMSLIYMPDSQWGLEDEQTFWSIIYPGYPELRMRTAYMSLKAMPKE